MPHSLAVRSPIGRSHVWDLRCATSRCPVPSWPREGDAWQCAAGGMGDHADHRPRITGGHHHHAARSTTSALPSAFRLPVRFPIATTNWLVLDSACPLSCYVLRVTRGVWCRVAFVLKPEGTRGPRDETSSIYVGREGGIRHPSTGGRGGTNQRRSYASNPPQATDVRKPSGCDLTMPTPTSGAENNMRKGI